METRIELEGGKYAVVHENGAGLRALRYGEPWRDLTGDGLVLAMAQEIEALRPLAEVGRELAERDISLPPLDDVSDYVILSVRKGTMTEQAQQCLERIVVAISNNEPVTIAAGGQAAMHDVLGERQRQVVGEGFSTARDDGYTNQELADAGAQYALRAGGWTSINVWPWKPDTFKEGTPREMLVKAGALILAEIERLDRASAEVQS